MARKERQYKYIIISQEGEAYGTDDGPTAEHASMEEEQLVIETKTGLQLDTAVVIPEYPQYEPEGDDDPEDL